MSPDVHALIVRAIVPALLERFLRELRASEQVPADAGVQVECP